MTDVLSDEEIERRLLDLSSRPSHGEHRYYRPLSDAVNDYEHWATTPEKRIYLGLDAFDEVMRGTAPGEMTQFVGYTQSGKTLLLTNMMLYNREKSMAWFTPDETRTLVMIRLACVLHSVSAHTIEYGLMTGNREVRRMLDETAEAFPMLGIYDEGLNLVQMIEAMEEQAKAVGREPEGIIFDYAALLAHEGDVRGKMEALKNFGKNVGKPLFVVQQTSRHKGRDGESLDLDSGEYSGEQQATHMIGVRRKWQYYVAALKDVDKKLASPAISFNTMIELENERNVILSKLEEHRDTITINLIKNKRPPGNLVDEIDFTIDRETGRLNEYRPAYNQAPAQPTISQRVFGNG